MQTPRKGGGRDTKRNALDFGSRRHQNSERDWHDNGADAQPVERQARKLDLCKPFLPEAFYKFRFFLRYDTRDPGF